MYSELLYRAMRVEAAGAAAYLVCRVVEFRPHRYPDLGMGATYSTPLK